MFVKDNFQCLDLHLAFIQINTQIDIYTKYNIST